MPAGFSEKYTTGTQANAYNNGNPLPNTYSSAMNSGQTTTQVVNIDTIASTSKWNNSAVNMGSTSSSTDRSLGVSPTTTEFNVLQFDLTNNTGVTLSGATALTVSYTLKVWKNGGWQSPNWNYNDELKGYTFYYSTNGTNFTKVAGLSNAGGSTGDYAVGPVTLSAVSLANGATINFWWADDNADVASPDQPISIDNLVITPEPATLSLLALGALVALRRRSRK